MSRIRSFFQEKGFRGLLKRNFTTVLSILLIPVLISFVILMVLFNRTQFNTLMSQAENSLVRISTQTDVLLNDMANLAFTTSYAETTSAFRRHVDAPLNAQKLTALRKLQSSLQTDDSKSSTVVFQTEDGGFLVTAQTATTLWSQLDLVSYQYQRFLNISASAPEGASITHDVETVTFCSRADVGDGMSIYSFVDIQKTTLLRRFREQLPFPDSYLLVVDGNGGAVVTPNNPITLSQSLLAYSIDSPGIAKQITLDGKHFLLLSCRSNILDWTYIQLLPSDAFIHTQQISFFVFLVALLLVAAGGLWFCLSVSLRLYHPIQIITQLLNDPQQGTIGYYRTYCQQYDDMELIRTLIESSHFQKLAISDALEEQNRITQQAQNYALAVQMNPHFIFNTLDCINWRVMTIPGDNEDIISAIGDFSKIMRYALKQKGLVPLMEELNMGRIYIRLRNTLGTSPIRVSWDIDETVPTNAKVPFLILQPLLENAITHGLQNSQEDRKLQVRCRIAEETLVLEVTDNGVGFPPERLAQFQSMLASQNIPEDTGHIGLLNTHNRIRLTYGNHYGIRIASQPGHTVISVQMPLADTEPPQEL